jgi:hypothetical protein
VNPSKIKAREFYGKVRQAVSTKSMVGSKFTHSSGKKMAVIPQFLISHMLGKVRICSALLETKFIS